MMKASDIPDEHVIELARKWRDSARVNLEELGVVDALVAEGVPPKVALRKVEKLARRGLLEYGGSAHYAWPA